MTAKIDVILDSREHYSRFKKLSRNKEVNLTVEALQLVTEEDIYQLGDIKIGETHVELCTYDDLKGKLHSGRMLNQIADMLMFTKCPILVVYKHKTKHSKSTTDDCIILEDRCDTLNMSIPTYTFNSKSKALSDLDIAIDWILAKAKYLQSGEYVSYIKRPVRVKKHPDPKIQALCGFVGIREELAKRILKAYDNNLHNAMDNIETWDKDVKGVGEKKKQKIKEIWG